LVPRTDVDEVDVQSVDFGDELRIRIELRLHLAPVVVLRPIAREGLGRGELDALRVVGDRFPLGPARRGDAPAQFREIRLRKTHGRRTNGGLVTAGSLCNLSHGETTFRKIEKAYRSDSNGCRCGSGKATATEAGRFLHDKLLGAEG